MFENRVITDKISNDKVILSRVDPYSNMTGVLIRDQRGDYHVTTKAEIEVMQLQPKGDQRMPVNHQDLGGSKEGFPSRFPGVWPCQCLDLGLLPSRTVRQYISVILSHSVCNTLLLQPQETNTEPPPFNQALPI